VLRYFRINDPYRLLGLLFLLSLACLPLLIDLPAMTTQELKGMVLGEGMGAKVLYVELIDHTPPLMALTDGFLDFLFGRSLMGRHILGLLIILFQAAYFSILLINNKAYNESSYVPALIFGFLCCYSFDLLAITPELLASTLLLFALNNLFKEIEFRIERDSIVLNLGVCIGLASLFVFSYAIFLIGAVVMLTVYARATFRKIMLALFGFGLVHAGLAMFYYCYESLPDLWENFYLANLNLNSKNLVSWGSIFTLAIVPLSYFVFSLFMLTREARFTKYQSQLFQVIFWWMGIAVVQLWLAPERTPHSAITFVPPAAYFISHYLLLIRRKWIAEIMLWLFMGGLLSVNYLAYYHRLDRVSYAGLFPGPSKNGSLVVNKRIMIIGDDVALYSHNRMAGYFLDWDLSKKYFEQSDYYENLIRIHRSITQDMPDVIVDEKNMMGPILARIPAIQNEYRLENQMYWRKNQNVGQQRPTP